MEPTVIKGYTASQLAELTRRKRHAVEEWLSNNGFKPVNPELLYPPETLDALLKAKVGRPRKVPPALEPPAKPATKRGKAKK